MTQGQPHIPWGADGSCDTHGRLACPGSLVLAQNEGFVTTMLCDTHACTFHTPAVACGRGVVCDDDLPSLSARIAWKGAFLYNALERAHLFTTQGRALQGVPVAGPRTQAPPSEARASSETVRMPRRDTV